MNQIYVYKNGNWDLKVEVKSVQSALSYVKAYQETYGKNNVRWDFIPN